MDEHINVETGTGFVHARVELLEAGIPGQLEQELVESHSLQVALRSHIAYESGGQGQGHQLVNGLMSVQHLLHLEVHGGLGLSFLFAVHPLHQDEQVTQTVVEHYLRAVEQIFELLPVQDFLQFVFSERPNRLLFLGSARHVLAVLQVFLVALHVCLVVVGQKGAVHDWVLRSAVNYSVLGSAAGVDTVVVDLLDRVDKLVLEERDEGGTGEGLGDLGDLLDSFLRAVLVAHEYVADEVQ